MTYGTAANPAGEPGPPVAGTPATAAQWLRALRAHRRLSQRELSRRAGLPVSTVSRIESGAADPRYTTFVSVIRACGLELAARDHTGALILRERVREAVRDRGGRHQPAHLFLFRTPSETSTRSSEWWGWGRIAFRDGDPRVPEWTYRRRRAVHQGPQSSGLELGYLWDDAT